MNKPLIQIDDEIREMTNDEYAEYLKVIAEIPELPLGSGDDVQ